MFSDCDNQWQAETDVIPSWPFYSSTCFVHVEMEFDSKRLH